MLIDCLEGFLENIGENEKKILTDQESDIHGWMTYYGTVYTIYVQTGHFD